MGARGRGVKAGSRRPATGFHGCGREGEEYLQRGGERPQAPMGAAAVWVTAVPMGAAPVRVTAVPMRMVAAAAEHEFKH
jgi:hypothetical protein